MSKPDSGFRERVEAVVAQIPKGRVMTYGQIAALCGNARAARIVGGIAHFGDSALPWQRVVNRHGGLAAGYPGGRAAHAAHLAAEGLRISDERVVDFESVLWAPGSI
ncbi:MAG: MGMT family protein [Candidatus Saccharimonadales bacterium]